MNAQIGLFGGETRRNAKRGGKETAAKMLARKKRLAARTHGSYAAYKRAERAKLAARGLNSRGEPLKPRPTKDWRLDRARRRLIYALKVIVWKHPETIEINRQRAAERGRAYMFAKYHGDPKVAIYHRVKRWMQKHLKERGHNSHGWSNRLGYTAEQLHAHLEASFQPGMTWANMGKWHIDHVRPVVTFRFSSPDDQEFRDCYALSNLQPLWAKDNHAKGGRWEGRDYRAEALRQCRA
jgi:hypothetical protein